MIKKSKMLWDLSRLHDETEGSITLKKRQKISETADEFNLKWLGTDVSSMEPRALLDALDEYELWFRFCGYGGDELYYYGLRTSQDENNPRLKAKFNQAIDFANSIEDKMRFFELSIAKIASDEQDKFLRFDPLQKYRHFLEKIFAYAKYQLSEKEEAIISKKYTVAHYGWTTMVSGLMSKEEIKGEAFNKILSKIDDPNKTVRDIAARNVNAILEKHVEVAENEINAVLANKKIDDELRGFTRPDQSRHLADDIESSVVDALIESVSDRFDISRRFYKLKARLMRKKKLAYHERNVPFGKFDRKFTYSASLKLVRRVVNNLDPEFGDILDRFDKNNQIDVYPRRGKRGGAFCAHELLSQPTYILLNHTDKLRDVQTLAHELGHGINNELMRAKQNALSFGTPTSTAEVASTFMEDFVLEELRKGADDKMKFELMVAKLGDDVSSIFRQVACYKFEQELHEKYRNNGYLSHQEIGKLFQKHMSAYMGPAVEQSPGSQNWWIYWSHIRNFFYVYSYASGLLISKSLQASVKKDPAFIGKVKDFLSAGMSDSPRNLFAKMGVNIENRKFWDKGLDEVERLLEEAEKLAL